MSWNGWDFGRAAKVKHHLTGVPGGGAVANLFCRFKPIPNVIYCPGKLLKQFLQRATDRGTLRRA